MMTAIAVAAALLATSAPPPADPLTTEIRALDAKVFDAYNRCDLPTFSGYFDPKVAFYHDTGGATFERDAMVDGVRKYICGKVKRELIRTTFRVYPIKDYGAIEEGEHRFLRTGDGTMRGDRQIRHGLGEAGWRLADHQCAQLRPPRRDASGAAKRH